MKNVKDRPHSADVLSPTRVSQWIKHIFTLYSDHFIMIDTFLKLAKSFFIAELHQIHVFSPCWLSLSLSLHLFLARANTQTIIRHMCKLRLGESNIIWSTGTEVMYCTCLFAYRAGKWDLSGHRKHSGCILISDMNRQTHCCPLVIGSLMTDVN